MAALIFVIVLFVMVWYLVWKEIFHKYDLLTGSFSRFIASFVTSITFIVILGGVLFALFSRN